MEKSPVRSDLYFFPRGNRRFHGFNWYLRRHFVDCFHGIRFRCALYLDADPTYRMKQNIMDFFFGGEGGSYRETYESIDTACSSDYTGWRKEMFPLFDLL